MTKGSEPDRERQERLVEQGAGNAVADLKAGYGQEVGRMEQAVERGRQIAEATGKPVAAGGSGCSARDLVGRRRSADACGGGGGQLQDGCGCGFGGCSGGCPAGHG